MRSAMQITRMTQKAFEESVTRDIRAIVARAKAQVEIEDQMESEGWAPLDDQESYWTSRDDGRSDGYGESYAERNS